MAIDRKDSTVDNENPASLAVRILALADAECLLADEASGAPEGSWGDRFFYVGPDRRHPFATIVEHDTPGFDEASRLDRPGVFRLNIELGKPEFQRRFGYPPAELPERLTGIDFTQFDEVLPHPSYGTYGWASVVNPGLRTRSEVDRLLAHAHRRAHDRHRRALHRQPPPSADWGRSDGAGE